MKKLLLLFAFTFFYNLTFSQTVVVTDDPAYTTGNASSVLDVKSVLKGFLTPRMTQVQRNAIATPADGLLIYQTDGIKGFYYYNNTVWTLIASETGSNWSVTGNGGNNANTNFLGTKDNVSLKIRTNNLHRVLIDSLGNVGIGSAPVFTIGTPRERFLVDAGSTAANPTTSYNAISGKGYLDSYLQLNIQNFGATANASSDIVASNNTATETVNFVNMGINSSGNTSAGILGGASNSYLYSTGNDFIIGNATPSKNLLFFTGGTATANEQMRIDQNGNIGIGTSSPAALLDVAGTYQLGNAGTVLNSMIKTSFTINDATNISNNSPRQLTVTVTGVTTGASLILNPRTALPTGIAIAWSTATAGNTILINFVNTSTTSRSLGKIVFDVTIIQ